MNALVVMAYQTSLLPRVSHVLLVRTWTQMDPHMEQKIKKTELFAKRPQSRHEVPQGQHRMADAGIREDHTHRSGRSTAGASDLKLAAEPATARPKERGNTGRMCLFCQGESSGSGRWHGQG